MTDPDLNSVLGRVLGQVRLGNQGLAQLMYYCLKQYNTF